MFMPYSPLIAWVMKRDLRNIPQFRRWKLTVENMLLDLPTIPSIIRSKMTDDFQEDKGAKLTGTATDNSVMLNMDDAEVRMEPEQQLQTPNRKSNTLTMVKLGICWQLLQFGVR